MMVDERDGGGETERTCCNWLACSKSGGGGEERRGREREGTADLYHAYATAAATLSYFMI